MAREKKSMIGFDPLAWLDNDEPETNKNTNKKNAEKTATATKKTSNNKEANNNMLLDRHIDEEALLKGYVLLERKKSVLFVEFLKAVFAQHVDVKKIYKNEDINFCADKVHDVIKLLINNLHNEVGLKDELLKMASYCQAQGLAAQDFASVVELFVSNNKKIIGRSWTKAIDSAGSELLTGVEEIISAAYKDETVEDQEIEMEAAVMSENTTSNESVQSENSIDLDHPVLQLNCIQDISKSQALKNDMLKLINDNDEIDIDASDVERIDGSALQLLCALFNYAHQNNLVIHWIQPSDALKQAVNILGMQNILELT